MTWTEQEAPHPFSGWTLPCQRLGLLHLIDSTQHRDMNHLKRAKCRLYVTAQQVLRIKSTSQTTHMAWTLLVYCVKLCFSFSRYKTWTAIVCLEPLPHLSLHCIASGFMEIRFTKYKTQKKKKNLKFKSLLFLPTAT